ncbi:CYFA0S21e01002g1_1 [Cyberlindnera fabianii]|uniref:Large ribosomal subunit protein uL4m n=1 Tax=Cyberlindnera fabianii TaxID=36022 RepID=A0A061BGC3_CYBFA|nr:CYFA0S21e01002g1_1 [Cyberlindnera fabianii]
MFARASPSVRVQLRQQVARFATEAQVSPVAQHAQEPPKYVLTSLRHFPSLKPHTFQPVSSDVLNTPLRRDILWKAVVFDADNRRVGASNPKGRAEMGYSRKKLLPQKGTGKARSGDRGSPIRHDGGRAMARSAPNDHTSDLPKKVYGLAMRVALSDKYRNGDLVVVSNEMELPTEDSLATKMFLRSSTLSNKKLLFITDNHCKNLLKSTEPYAEKIDVIQKEGIQVRDILHAQKVLIDLESLKWMADEYDI